MRTASWKMRSSRYGEVGHRFQDAVGRQRISAGGARRCLLLQMNRHLASTSASENGLVT